MNWPSLFVDSLDKFFHTYETAFVLFLTVLGNYVLPMGLDNLQATLKVTSELYMRN